MQICRLHYQRQTNHFHAETYAIFQKKDGLGDCKPQAVVMWGWQLWSCTVASHIMMMVEFYSPGKDSQMGDLNSGNNFHTSSSDQEPAQRFPSSAKSSWKDVAGATNHCLQLLLQFFLCMCQTAAQMLWFVWSSQNCFWNYTCANHTLRWNVHFMFLCHNQLSLITHWLTCTVLSVKVKKLCFKSRLHSQMPKSFFFFPPDIHTWELHTMVGQSGSTHEITHIRHSVAIKVLSLFQAGLPG